MTGLEQMSHVWLIFQFHLATAKAKPLVRPPRASERLIGLYATRSPYRPSCIGLSLVQIDQIKNKKLYLKNVDLLDGTPIFDIKPYHAESDVALNPRIGWMNEIKIWKYELSDLVIKKIDWLKAKEMDELEDFIFASLSSNPLQKNRKRIKQISDDQTYLMAYRTWRFKIQIQMDSRSTKVLDLVSGYSLEELKSKLDPYQDKKIHQLFFNTHFLD
jgi:tRNA (Thr-GGU) A37 N-methylase